MRKFLLLLTLLLTAALALCGAQAEGLTCGSFTYTLNEDGTATVTGYTGEETDLVIPAELDGIPVSSVGEWALFNCQAETITVSEGISALKECAFAKCPNLKEVFLPAGIELGVNPFNSCPELTEIHPKGDRYEILGSALYDTALDTLVMFMPSDPATVAVVREGTSSIGTYAFHDCVNLHRIILPDSVTVIGDQPSCPARVLSPWSCRRM